MITQEKPVSPFTRLPVSPLIEEPASGPAGQPANRPTDFKRPFLYHLEELRRRLLRCFLWVGLGTLATFRFSADLLALLIHPVGEVVFLSPAEPFLVHLKVSILGGLLLSAPLLAWEIWGFFSPALRPGERRPVFLLVPVSAALFVLGAWFSWGLLLPTSLKFLLSFGSGSLKPMITVGHYLSFAGWLILAGGLIFQMPVAALVLARLGLIRPAGLCRQWRAAVVGILLAAAVLTPTPDVVTQLILAVPMSGLYLASIGLAALVSRP